MTSIVLQTLTRIMSVPIALVSLWMLWRGHDMPGGGFVAGLVAAAGLGLWYLAFGLGAVYRIVRVRGSFVMGAGLTLASLVGFTMLLAQRGFLGPALWKFHLPLLGAQKVTASLVFDTGVYLVVVGMVVTLLEILAREDEDERDAG